MEYLLPGLTYHIYNHANGDENIFREEKNYPFFLRKYEKHITPIAETYAYCLMPNHFHLMIKIRNERTFPMLQTFPKFKTLEKLNENETANWLSKQFANLFSAYTQSYNKTYNRNGSLFLKNFKRKLITTSEQFQSTFLYIHLNPVKHGFIKNEQEWKWSSLRHYTNHEKVSLLNTEEVVSRFGDGENLLYCMKERRERILSMQQE